MKIDRRRFIFSTALVTGIPGMISSLKAAPLTKDVLKPVIPQPDNILVGVIAKADNPEDDLMIVREMGIHVCQVTIGEYSPVLAKKLKATLEKYDIKATSMICSLPGPEIYTFREGPQTIGLIPRKYRKDRIERIRQGIDFCTEAGIPAIQSHFGFIPENPNDELYKEFIETMKPLGDYALKNGIDIYFETGQETPVTLLRAITDIGTGNLFVNYDTANLILYGKANPVDGLKVIGKYVRSLHAKDGKYPADPYKLG
ncbi:MAG TPA: sugar phosphate isomerase/epimerase family protein, partial [Bacteroidales bacterium]|nr:sugar phosphate isomerase/epimerase family protein [Bacteroidales bacterium]